MPRWGAERRARPLHEVRAASVLPQGGKEKGRAPHRFSMRPDGAPLGAPPPFFYGRRFLATLFGLAFLGVFLAKLGCEGASRQRKDSSSPGLTLCSSPPGLTRWSMPNGRVQFGPTRVLRSSMDRRVKPGDEEERGSSPVVTKRERGQDHERQTGKHAKLPRAAYARRVAGAAIACAHPIGPAGAVRFAGIVPLLRRQALPPAAHMLRRRPGGVRLEALVPQEGEAQDAAERMEPARAPEIVVAPRAAKPARPNPSRRGFRSAISGWSDDAFAAVARRGYFGLSPPR